ncbi:class I adenylate-forming enzyme family protein [Streptomyces sp. NPDC002067]
MHGVLHDILESAAARHPHAPALRSQHGALTYAEFEAAVARTAVRLRAAGLGRGDRVVITAGDAHGIGIVLTAYAASRLGAVFSVLHEQVRGEPLRHVLADCEPRVVVCDDDSVHKDAADHGARFLLLDALTGDDPGQPAHTAPRLQAPGPLPVDPVSLIYTSGTTSLPKAVVSTHQQVLFAATAIQRCLRYRADDVIFCPLPLSFDYGLYQVHLAALSGACLYLGTSAEAGPPLLRRLAETGATVLPAVPTVADRLAWLVRRSSGGGPGKLRLLTNTGAALAESTLAELREALPDLRIQVMYGLTECKRTAIMPVDGDLGRPGSCGVPLPGTEVFVIGDDGERLAPGEIGQFVVRGPHVMAGYWRRPDLDAERFPRVDGLFPELRTGDYGWLDEDGYLYFSGRRDDLYKERGFRISTTEVEAAARKIPGVTAAAVLAPTEDRPAVLAVTGELTGDEVRRLLPQHIEPFKIPRRCVHLPQLPVNGNGKVDRKRLALLVGPPAGHPTTAG